MKIYDATVLVTGAHRGLGLALVRESLALDALEAGAEEVIDDERARQLKQGLSAEPGVYLLDPSADAPVAPAVSAAAG